jgi:hypothetical protein
MRLAGGRQRASALQMDAEHGSRHEGSSLLGPFVRPGRRWGDMSIPADLLGLDMDELEWTIDKLSRDPSARAATA